MRSALNTLAAALLIAMALAASASGEGAKVWTLYKERFITPDGRVRDPMQEQHSTSEGQGYGMLLAVANADRAAFDLIWRWTEDNLTVRKDALIAWRWGKRPSGRWEVIDYNNATDGDILIAYALMKAADAWPGGQYRDAGLRIVRAIKEELAIAQSGRTYLLPGYYGFVRQEGVVLNPSYLLFPAYKSFARNDDRTFWDRVYADAASLIEASCVGSPCLPPDWVVVGADGSVGLFKERLPYFGFEAVRTVLNLSWDYSVPMPDGVRTVIDAYRRLGYIPAWVDLEKGSVAMEPASAGFYAIYGRAVLAMGDRETSRKLFDEARRKLEAERDNYYSFSLYLLAISENLP